MAKARPSMRSRQEQANKARARMAKRAKRARFFKEHKKNLLLLIGGFIFIAGFMIFTPFGPEWYYNRVKQRMFAAPGEIMPGTMKSLYSLGKFYENSFRKEEATKIYDEMANAYYGFTFSQFSVNPQTALDKRYAAEQAIKKSGSVGPPYRMDTDNLRYIGFALAATADLAFTSGRSRQFAQRLYEDLYMQDFYKDHPEACDPKTTELMKAAADRMAGRR